jgi:hypothetical protein
VLRVEHPDVGTAYPGCRELWIKGDVLPTVCRRDEGAGVSRSPKDDVTGFITHEQGADDTAARPAATEFDYAYTVGEMIDDPHLAVAPRRDGHGLEPDRHGSLVDETVICDAEDLKTVIWSVRYKEEFAARRECEGADLSTLEEGKSGGGIHQGKAEETPPQCCHERKTDTDTGRGMKSSHSSLRE